MINYLLKHISILIALEFFVTVLIIFEDTGILLIHKHKSDRSKNNFIDIYFYLRAVAFGLIIAISFLYLNFYKNNQNHLFNKAPSTIEKQSNKESNVSEKLSKSNETIIEEFSQNGQENKLFNYYLSKYPNWLKKNCVHSDMHTIYLYWVFGCIYILIGE